VHGLPVTPCTRRRTSFFRPLKVTLEYAFEVTEWTLSRVEAYGWVCNADGTNPKTAEDYTYAWIAPLSETRANPGGVPVWVTLLGHRYMPRLPADLDTAKAEGWDGTARESLDRYIETLQMRLEDDEAERSTMHWQDLERIDGVRNQLLTDAFTEHHAGAERVRILHSSRENADGTFSCVICADHGDIQSPCATIRALDGA